MITMSEAIRESVCERFQKVPTELVESVIKAYQEEVLNTLLEQGHTWVTPEIRIDVVPITPRRYVLRNQEYHSVRRYKLKASITDSDFFDKLSDEFDQLRDDLD